MQGHIVMLIAFGYVLGLTIIGVLAYLGIKGTDEAIAFQNRQRELTKSFERNKNIG